MDIPEPVNNRQILHVDMDAFFVSVEELMDPSLKGRPVVVGGSADTRGVVAAASYSARRYGIHSAMPMARAEALCPHLIRLPGNGKLYSQCSKDVFTLLQRFTPFVEQTSIDEGYLDLTGFQSLYGNLVQLADQIHRLIRNELGLPSSIGLSGSRMVSKIASDLAKPSGMIAVLPGQEQVFLAPLSVGRIPGVGPKTLESLRLMGVSRVGHILHLKEESLNARLGNWGSELRRRAAGLDDTPVRRRREQRSSIGAEITFPRDLTDRGRIKAQLRYLVEKASRRMRRERLVSRCVTVKIRDAGFKTRTGAATLKRPTFLDDPLYRTALDLFDGLWKSRHPVRLIGVRFSGLTPAGGGQLDLFSQGGDPAADLVEEIDRIRDRYGFGAVMTGLGAAALEDRKRST